MLKQHKIKQSKIIAQLHKLIQHKTTVKTEGVVQYNLKKKHAKQLKIKQHNTKFENNKKTNKKNEHNIYYNAI